jgi:hypothetical protein
VAALNPFPSGDQGPRAHTGQKSWALPIGGSDVRRGGPKLSHPDLKDKAGYVSYVRQGRRTPIITEFIEINIINIINVLIT